MSLYVAPSQLRVSLDPVEVQNAIAEIAKDLLGASSFALLIKDDVEGGCEVALSQGVLRRSGTLDTGEWQNAIAEIAKHLLGASSFALLIKDDVEGGCEVALSQGVRD